MQLLASKISFCGVSNIKLSFVSWSEEVIVRGVSRAVFQ